MMPDSSSQLKQGLGATFWWVAIPAGLILLTLNAGFYFAFPLAKFLGWRLLTSEYWTLQWLQYLLVCFLGFCFIGLLRGRATWTARAAARLTLAAGLIGILPIMVVSIDLGLVLMVGGDLLGGDVYLADAGALAPMIGGSEILAGVAGVLLGRLIGNRFLHWRPDPMRATRR